MKKAKADLCEADMDLAQIRKAKRLLNRAVRELEALEKTIVKWRKPKRERIPNEAERAVIERLYAPFEGEGTR